MAKVTIGGTIYEVPELNFLALERAWPFIEEAMIDPDPIKGVSSGIHIIASGLLEADNFNTSTYGITPDQLQPTLNQDQQIFELVTRFLKKKTRATEISGIRDAIVEICREAGLEPKEGEETPAEPLSPETLTHT